jgi:hypothetical protein
VIRRRPFELPGSARVPDLVALLQGRPPARPADPAGLVDAAIAHGLATTLAEAVSGGAVALDPVQRSRLGRVASMRLARSRALRAELDGLGALLGEACGTAPVCVKGPAVADRLYDDPDRRPFGDLDLLVPRERLRGAADSMLAAGWIEDVEFSREFAAQHGHELHLRRRRGGVWLHCELHWRIGDDRLCEPLDHALLAAGATPLPGAPAVLGPRPGAELLVLCVHFLGDRERRLAWIQDIALAASAADEEEWEWGFQLAEGLGLSWALHRGLDYAARYLGLDRSRPRPAGGRPAFGPLRAVEELDLRASLHVGRLAALHGRERLAYLRTVLLPSAEGLAGTAGRDGASRPRAVLRHFGTALAGLVPRR